MRGDDVGHILRILRLTDDVLHIVGNLRVELHVGGELLRHPARQGAAARQRPIGRLQRCVADDEMG